MSTPKQVKIVEVGPRDGLQNETISLSLDDKVNFINQLVDCGLSYVEFGAFVSPKWVPQMAQSDAVYRGIQKDPSVTYGALVPNTKGLSAALDCGVKEIAVFTAASEKFSHKNTNCSIEESLQRIELITEACQGKDVTIRGYISCVAGCPYQGSTDANQVAEIAHRLRELGCYEVSLGDTIGVGTANQFSSLIDTVAQKVPVDQLAVHCHDTYGQALTNIYAALQMGVATIDASVAGLGGCPYAKGASGNVSTEDVVYLLHGMGISTGINLEALIQCSQQICQKLERENQSKVSLAQTTSA